MCATDKSDRYYQKAKKAYAYYNKYGFTGIFKDGWVWLLDKPERLTAISTFAIFLATAVAIGVGIAQWRVLNSTDETLRETMIIGQRAYVSPREIDFTNKIGLTLQNTGATPANEIRVFSNWEPIAKGLRNDFCKTFVFPERNQCQGNKSTAFLARNATFETGDLRCPVMMADNNKAVAGTIDLVLYGRIRYQDVFKENRITTFCYFLSSDGAMFCNCHNQTDPNGQ